MKDVDGFDVKNYYTPKEAAKKLGLKLSTVYKLIKTGRVRAKKVVSLYYIEKNEVEKLVEDV